MPEFLTNIYFYIILSSGLIITWWIIKIRKADSKTEFGLMVKFLKERRKEPSSSLAYWLYFLIIVLLIGISGSLISALPSYENGFDMNSTSLSLIGYAVVLLCSSSIELIFIDLNDEDSKYYNIKKGITMLGVALVIFSILFGIVTYFIPQEIARLVLSIVACIVAVYFWWITNARNLSVLDSPIPPSTDNTTGGNTNNLSGATPQEFTE
ncbi:hypothetical protein [uncultured Kordia sp.]|uniref:hypothetical protein n=1 Tax=uncultured Kordia sp. TaxID=507699 RepID=UPI0026236F3A|nr:hypothetical protein [uncultured Kordia sp.]